MRLAVTGATGRLGRSVVRAVEAAAAAWDLVRWTRSELDLDRPGGIPGLVEATRPDVVIHTAAWTDVDGCANAPGLAMTRNGEATTTLAIACAAIGSDLVYVSTNEVFDGERTDGHGYAPGDAVGPINAYGTSKLAGELGAREAYGSMGHGDPRLTIVRTAWLFGPPGPDFPAKIVGAAARAREHGQPLRVVADEVGSPTLAADLGLAMADHLQDPHRAGGTYHVVNAGQASRAAWAREVLRRAGIDVEVVDIASAEWSRPSKPPRWAVLEPSADFGPPLRDWRDALADSIEALVR